MRVWRVLVLLAAVSFANTVIADLRVTVLFDREGHRAFRVFRTGNLPTLEMRLHASPTVAGRAQDASDGGARIQWFGIGGSPIYGEAIRDPRIVHAPVSNLISDGKVEYAIRERGIYRLRGPDTAVSVRVNLPAIESVQRQLPAEQWSFKVEP